MRSDYQCCWNPKMIRIHMCLISEKNPLCFFLCITCYQIAALWSWCEKALEHWRGQTLQPLHLCHGRTCLGSITHWFEHAMILASLRYRFKYILFYTRKLTFRFRFFSQPRNPFFCVHQVNVLWVYFALSWKFSVNPACLHLIASTNSAHRSLAVSESNRSFLSLGYQFWETISQQ